MNRNFEIVNPIKESNWNDQISANNPSAPFLTSNWARVLSESYGYKPAYFVSSTGSTTRCIFPFMDIKSPLTGHRGVSLPFSDYCIPEFDRPGDAVYMLHDIIDYGREHRWRQCEFRSTADFPPDLTPSSVFFGHRLDITESEKDIFASFKKRTRRCIRKAELAGLQTSIETSPQAAREFFRLHCLTRRKHGLPPQPWKFFSNIQKYLLAEDLGSIVLARLNGNTIAGSLYLHTKGQVIYKYAAADDRYHTLCSSSLVIWSAIQYYRSRGMKLLSFGRCAPGNEGLRHFKQGWGTEEYQVEYLKYDIRKKKFVSRHNKGREPGIAPLRKMPVAVLKVLGAAAYKHMG